MENELKQVIIIRSDLKMGKGKIASQAAHASVLAYLKTSLSNPKLAKKWLELGMPKIVLKVSTLDELLDIYKKLQDNSIVAVIIQDAGRTQIQPNTITALGAGPAQKSELDKFTKHLKLL
jgi:PTH2 family peptidyl-tRNA hydrolase